MSNKLKMLDLFCGTKSIANAFDKRGFETFTIDNNPEHYPDKCINISYITKSFFTEYYDVIWASPPCTAFSIAAISHHWKRDKGLHPKSKFARTSLRLLKHTIKLIDELKPKYWFIENPVGLMRKMDCMDWKPRSTITYCQYGDNRMKPTDIWGTFPKSFPVRRCKNGDGCHVAAPRGSQTGTQGLKNAIERAMIPKGFCNLLAEHIASEMNKT